MFVLHVVAAILLAHQGNVFGSTPSITFDSSGTRTTPGNDAQSANISACNQRACIQRCCFPDEDMITDICYTDDDDDFSPTTYRLTDLEEVRPVNHSLGLVYGDFSLYDMFVLDPINNINDVFYLLEDGRLYVPLIASEPLNTTEFCVEPLGSGKYEVYLCFPANESEVEEGPIKPVDVVYPVCMLLSLPFLAATFLVYTVIPRLGNLHGRVLRCYVGTLFLGYLFLALNQLQAYDIGSTSCIIAAFIIYFSFLASFFWLNVMCFDIWWTFSGFRPLRGSEKEREHKKFIIYSIYAWGSSMLLLLVCLLMDLLPGIPEHVVAPQIGDERCWFLTKEAEAAYFYGPMAVIVVCNIILFVLTALRILQLKRETAMLKGEESRRHDVEENKQRFVLYLKLFVVMGVNWGMEVISFIVGGPQYLWYITDIGNTLQGVLIFLIFVWKEKIRRLLIKRLCPRLTRNTTRTNSNNRGTMSRSVATPTSSFSLTTKATTNGSGEAMRMTREESDIV